jgi:hypothetical protein
MDEPLKVVVGMGPAEYDDDFTFFVGARADVFKDPRDED